MEFSISLGIAGWLVLLVGAVVLGVAVQMVGEAASGYEWVATAIGAGLGALVASEFIVAWRTFEPVWDALAIVPAVGGALVVGLLFAVVARLATGPTLFRRTAA